MAVFFSPYIMSGNKRAAWDDVTSALRLMMKSLGVGVVE